MPPSRRAVKAFSVTLLVLSMTVLASAQSIAETKGRDDKSSQKNGNASTTALATPADWGSAAYRLFRKDSRQVTFALETSWIPGENHKRVDPTTPHVHVLALDNVSLVQFFGQPRGAVRGFSLRRANPPYYAFCPCVRGTRLTRTNRT